MDISFWLSIISLALIIPLGIVTNLLTPRIITYLENRKLIKSRRTKEQDLAAYKSVKDFKNGTRDKYPVFLALAVFSVNCAIGAAVCVLLAALKYGTLDEATLFFSQPIVFLSLLAFLFFLLSILFLILIVTTERRIERFDEYTAEIRTKWGNDVV